VGAALLLLAGFALGRGMRMPPPASTPAPELATYMSEVQHRTHKLDLALQARNRQLALFYLHELRETFETIEQLFPEHDGQAVTALTRAVAEARLPALEERIRSASWEGTTSEFALLLEACNSCHAATQHGFIEIRSTASNPFNQSFAGKGRELTRGP
jgi:hypothetical protein